MSNHANTLPQSPTSAVDDVFTPQAVAELLGDLSYAEVAVRTTRRVAGLDLDDPGMRDFTATLSVLVNFTDLDDIDDSDGGGLPEWFNHRSWADVSDQDKRALLARVSPTLAELATDLVLTDQGPVVELLTAQGSILNPYRLRGHLFDALDSRSQEHADLYPALTTDCVWGGIGLKESLDELVEGVGDIVLLTDVASSPAWQQVQEGLESALLAQVLQDVAVGACAVITYVGTLPAKTKADRAHQAYVQRFWADASFDKWRHGIWYASPNLRIFGDAALPLEDMLS